MKRAVLNLSEGNQVDVEVIRRGRQNTRVVFADGHQELVPTIKLGDSLGEPVSSDISPNGSRVVPLTPLRRFYGTLRGLQGSSEERFRLLQSHLRGRHGPSDAVFLSELFKRSRDQLSSYSNIDEPFFQIGSREEPTRTEFARLAVDLIANGAVEFREGTPTFTFLAYEINPLRTTRSCFETGRPARTSGAGGIDLLLDAGDLPAVAEIKAKTETAGPTFALIQALTYAVELVTVNQWQRLGRHFDRLRHCCNSQVNPCIDVIILMESFPFGEVFAEDLGNARQLASDLVHDDRVSLSIRKIVFLKGEVNQERTSLNVGLDYSTAES